MAMVNPNAINPLFNPNVKDSRWLTLEVCREFTRSKCSRSENECKFAHPPPHVEVQNGRVTCCFDSIKGKCQRREPPCKYLHPPQHLKEQLLQNGRNNLILKNLQMQALAAGLPSVPVMPSLYPVMYEAGSGKAVYPQSPGMPAQYSTVVAPQYMVQNPAVAPHQFNPYSGVMSPAGGMTGGLANMMQTMDASGATVPVSANSQLQAGVVPNATVSSTGQQKMQRADRLEQSTQSSQSMVINARSNSAPSTWAGPTGVGMHDSPVVAATAPTPTSQQLPHHYSQFYFQGMGGVPGNMMPMVKRAMPDNNKGGMPMYSPSTSSAAYQQAIAAMHLQQPFVPVTIAGHPPGVPRF